MDIRVEKATVESKDIQYQKNGDLFIPDHRLAYCVMFSLGNGEKVVLEVPEDKYELLNIGDTKELAWQAHMICSFGNIDFPTYP